MRVSSINANNFYPNFSAKKYSGDIYPAKRNDLSRAEKITICALSAAAVGVGLATIALTKKNSDKAKSFIKKQKFFFNKKMQNVQKKQDPIVKMLKGKRDSVAVNDYKAYITKKKMNSLNQKVLNNQINMDDPKILKHIVRNKINMERNVMNLLT